MLYVVINKDTGHRLRTGNTLAAVAVDRIQTLDPHSGQLVETPGFALNERLIALPNFDDEPDNNTHFWSPEQQTFLTQDN